jgi:hypothetical protein
MPDLSPPCAGLVQDGSSAAMACGLEIISYTEVITILTAIVFNSTDYCTELVQLCPSKFNSTAHSVTNSAHILAVEGRVL